jgi:hypothetical protein
MSIFQSLPFTFDCEKSIQVYEQSKLYLEQTDYKERLSSLAWAFHDLLILFPLTDANMFSGYIFPWKDSCEELQISFNLCMFGFYKQAMSSLRSALELGLLSVYWNLNDDGHDVIKSWISSEQDTPRITDIWKKIEEHKNFQAFQKVYDIKSRLLSLNYLHHYVHTKGHRYSNTFGRFKSNCQTFEQQETESWIRSYEEVVTVLVILHLVKFPIGTIRFDYSSKFGIDTPGSGGLDEFQVDRVENVVGSNVFKSIEAIAKVDQFTLDVIKWVKGLPDMTDEGLENQIRNFDKLQIRQVGFDHWLQNERIVNKDFPETTKQKKRFKVLEEWAKENNYEKSKIERCHFNQA